METKKKILIAEDEKNLLSLLKSSFEENGFSVFTAKDGIEALEFAQKEKPDLILVDILMPGLDGITAVKKIREAGIISPVIFLTNLEDAEHISQAIEVKDSDYIVKSDMRLDDIIDRAKVKLNVK